MTTFLTGLMISIMAVFTPATAAQKIEGNDFQIVSDTVKDGIRYIHATPSEMVCATAIDIEIKVSDHTIRKCKFTRGCSGNSRGIGALLEGMTCEEAIRRLEGIPCGNRPTSCPDQLARVLSSLKWGKK